MKRVLIFLLCVGLLSECRDRNPEPAQGPAKLGQVFEAQPKQTVVITDLNTASDPELRFNLLSLEHWFCPITADCCGASNVLAHVTLDFQGQTSAPVTISLLNLCRPGAKPIEKVPIGGRTFEVTMEAVRPNVNFLTKTQPQPFKSATFTVR